MEGVLPEIHDHSLVHPHSSASSNMLQENRGLSYVLAGWGYL